MTRMTPSARFWLLCACIGAVGIVPAIIARVFPLAAVVR
jgi:hypothetical protein